MSSENQFHQFRPEELQQLVQTTLANEVEHHPSLPSTNSHALSRASLPATTLPATSLPLLVVTDRQTAGRGRGANAWWSAPGALTFSLLLELPDAREQTKSPSLALTAGIAVCEALHQLSPGLDAALKWPNDVFVRERKICGILVESPSQAPHRMVVGVGVNVNNSLSEAPESVRDSATSLRDMTGYSIGLPSVLTTILQQLAAHLDLLQHEPARLQQLWDTFCMLTGRSVYVAVGSQRISGTCQGIDKDGALLVETTEGVKPCRSGEVIRWD